MRRINALAAAALAAGALTGLAVGCSERPTHHCTPQNTTLGCQLVPRSGVRLGAPPSGVKGIDFAWTRPTAAWMRAQGYRFGASYLSSDPSKDWTAALARSFAIAGIARVYVWETYANRALGGCSAGQADARAAKALGKPLGARAYYFAVDFDETPAQAAPVASYFRCADTTLGIAHVGAYGGYWVVSRLFDAHLITYGWQTYAWSGGLWDKRAQLRQWLNGEAWDYDVAVTKDYGQTPYSKPKPRPKPHPKPSPYPSPHAQLVWLKGLRHQLLLALTGTEARIHSLEKRGVH